MTRLISAMLLTIIGIGLIWYSVGFLPALGVYLAFWGNNITNSTKYVRRAV